MKTANKDLNYKLGLLKLAIELNNVSLACKIFGCSRPTYYRYKKLYLEGGKNAFKVATRRETETFYPGYLVAQDTCYVGCIKGVGFVYLQTAIDTYSKVAFAKLYVHKNAVVAANLLRDKVVPFFEENGLRLHRILTDRGTEYCGNIDRHEYQLFLANKGIKHTRTKPRSPQTNGICERFNRTFKNEFLSVKLRSEMYSSKEEFQQDADIWLNY